LRLARLRVQRLQHADAECGRFARAGLRPETGDDVMANSGRSLSWNCPDFQERDLNRLTVQSHRVLSRWA
jgi:hypothetical protein